MKVVRDLAGATAAFILMPVVIAGLGAALYVAGSPARCVGPSDSQKTASSEYG